jgi:diguanylate cyclase (GGDEF)-like protein
MQEANKKLSYEAAHDPLTGLYNRSSFELLQKQHRDRGFALLLIDVDKFKHINDTYGHDMGDKVLIRVARVLQDSFREADKVCRIGGDEFCVIMLDAASSVKDTIREKVAAVEKALSTPENGIPPVTLSVGVAFTDAQKDGESLYKNADRALYKVKEGGRNGCEFDG